MLLKRVEVHWCKLLDGKKKKNTFFIPFLGELLKDGTLDWSNMEGYKKLIKTFHLVDTGQDHAIDHDELKTWIHLKYVYLFCTKLIAIFLVYFWITLYFASLLKQYSFNSNIGMVLNGKAWK